MTGLGTPNPKLEQQPAVVNHSFVSADGLWKINLTKDFIALSTLRYTQWEDFALRLDKPLAQFIQVYEPAFFERVGLRYVNAVSRKALGLTDLLWDDLIRSPYLGILGEPDVDESKVGKSAMDTELTLEGGVRMKIPRRPACWAAARRTQSPSLSWTGISPFQAAPPPTRCPSFWVTCTSTPYAFSTAPSPRSSMRPWGLSPFWNSRKKARPASPMGVGGALSVEKPAPAGVWRAERGLSQGRVPGKQQHWKGCRNSPNGLFRQPEAPHAFSPGDAARRTLKAGGDLPGDALDRLHPLIQVSGEHPAGRSG